MSERIAVMGAGAVGCYIAAFLTRQGHDITIIDMWGQNVDTMRQNGLHISEPQQQFTVKVNALHLSEAFQTQNPFDTIFLAVKSYDTEWASHFVKRLLSPTGVVVNAQNCMNDSLTASIVGHHRQIGCVLSSIRVALWEPGHVNRANANPGHVVFRIGELHGRITKRAEELAKSLGIIDLASATSNIWGERWSKLTTNASTNPIIAMTGLGSQSVIQNPRARLLQITMAAESVRIGQAHGYQIEPIDGVPAEVWAKAHEGDIYEELDARIHPTTGAVDWRSSMAQDITKGRPTEIGYMNGYLVQRGREVSIPTPANSASVEVIKDIEAKRITPDPSNLERALSLAGL